MWQSRLMQPEQELAIARRFELAHTRLEVAGHSYDLLRPRRVDELISEEDFALDERIPYWADCWPSGRVLAARISAAPVAGGTLLELGCGIGLVSLAAAATGYRVLATDYYADALEFTQANAQRHGLSGVDTRLVDWRRLPPDLGTFDRVVAADVLYEAPYAALVAATFAATLATDGRGLLCDPGRRTADSFAEECRRHDLAVHLVDRVGVEDAGARLTVSVLEIARR